MCVLNHINSLAPGRFELNFICMALKLVLLIDGWGIYCVIAFRWMSLQLTDDKSTFVQVMAWCHQATSHYLRQCRPRSLSSSLLIWNQCWPSSIMPFGIYSRTIAVPADVFVEFDTNLNKEYVILSLVYVTRDQQIKVIVLQTNRW